MVKALELVGGAANVDREIGLVWGGFSGQQSTLELLMSDVEDDEADDTLDGMGAGAVGSCGCPGNSGSVTDVARTGAAKAIGAVLGVHPSIVKQMGVQALTSQPGRALQMAGVHPRVALVTGLLRPRGGSPSLSLGSAVEDDDDGSGEDGPSVTPGGPAPDSPAAIVARTPGAVPLVENAWDLDAGTYVLQSGDTLMGLSISYLGDRTLTGILKIWHAQPNFATRDKNKLNAGEKLVMPPEAVANARKLFAHPGATIAPNGKVVDSGGKAVNPNAAEIVSTVKGMSTAKKIGLGVLACGAVWGVSKIL